MDTYKRMIAKTIAYLLELQEGYDEGTEEWQAYDDMIDAIVELFGQKVTERLGR
jgi:hypothetical protein